MADFAHHIAGAAEHVSVLAPHYAKAKTHEMIGAIAVTRYRYFLPVSAEDIAYNGGGVSKIKKTPSYAIKLICFVAAQFFQALAIALTRRITIINAHWLIPQGFVGVFVAFFTRRKLVVTVHGSDVLTLNGKYMKKIKAFTLRHADVVCVNSSVTLAACQQLYDRDYQLIPMGIDIERFQNVLPSVALRKQYNLGDFTILFVGRLSHEKGIMYLLAALLQLQQSHRSFTALIVGSGPLQAELQAFITSHQLDNVVKLVGWVDSSELPQYYKLADIVVGPSLYEAQGLVFLEALASGVPVITTNQGGTKDFVLEGENGFMVTPQSADEIFMKLVALYDDRPLLHRMAQQAVASVTTTYAWDTVAAQYLRLFEELV
ncbi:MAG: glycosyltransferase family 4 protein [Candidatus Saccharimonadales bacterium]